jgi:hypothetical protein
MVRIFTAHAVSFLAGEVFDPLIRLEVELNPPILSLVVVPLEGVTAVAIHMAIGSGSSTIREEDSDLMYGLRCRDRKL